MTREELDKKVERLVELARSGNYAFRSAPPPQYSEAYSPFKEYREVFLAELLAAWDARFNEGIEAAAKRVGGMPYESCFPFCEHTIDGAVKRIRALRKE